MRLQRVVIYPENGLCIWKGTSNEGSAQTPLGYLAYTRLFEKGGGVDLPAIKWVYYLNVRFSYRGIPLSCDYYISLRKWRTQLGKEELGGKTSTPQQCGLPRTSWECKEEHLIFPLAEIVNKKRTAAFKFQDV
jgi:hypothetical protein